MIFGSSGALDGFADIPRAPKTSLTSFFVMIYTSSRWLDERIGAKMRPRPSAAENQILINSSCSAKPDLEANTTIIA